MRQVIYDRDLIACLQEVLTKHRSQITCTACYKHVDGRDIRASSPCARSTETNEVYLLFSAQIGAPRVFDSHF